MIIYSREIRNPSYCSKEGESVQRLDFLTEEEYLNILDTLPADNQYLDDFDPNKFVAKMGAECIMDLLARIDLDEFLTIKT
jgi:DNA-directed RNA polymerase subunit beta'